MSTVDVTDSINHETGERVFLLDDKDYVAVFVTLLRNSAHSELTCRVHIRAITKDGVPQCDAFGKLIDTYHTRSMFADGIIDFASSPGANDGVQGLVLDTVRIALGDSDEETLGEVNDNIRNVLQAADALSTMHSDATEDAIVQWSYTAKEGS